MRTPRGLRDSASRAKRGGLAPALCALALCACALDDSSGSLDAAVASQAEAGTAFQGGGRWATNGRGMHPPPSGPDGAVPDAGQLDPDIVGVAFQPIATRTSDGQTVAHMELTGIAFMPDDAGVLVWSKAGNLYHYRLEDDVLVLQGQTSLEGVYASSDCGLVGLAVDPDYAENHYLFVAHCVSPTHGAVFRYQLDTSNYDALRDSAVMVIEVGDVHADKAWHNLGSLGFFDDAEHSLWVLSGEKTVPENAQDLTNDLGAILRIVPRRGDGEAGYDPHPDNPFASDGADSSVSSGPDLYAWGLRSPWRGAIDAAGRIWIADVGSKIEEINLSTHAGQNFGWADFEGPCKEDCSKYSDPATSWNRSSGHRYRVDDADAQPTTKRCASLAAHYELDAHDRYRGFLDDSALFSDMCVGYVRALAVDGSGKKIRDVHVGHLLGLSGAAQGPDGYLYVTSFGSCSSSTNGVGSAIYRVIPRTEDDEVVPDEGASGEPLVDDPLGAFPLRLSDTGLFAGDRLTEPAPRAIAYTPSLPLWSNGSTKERFILLPAGTKVDNAARDAWIFPPGTLFVKTFSYQGAMGDPKRIETRVIRRTADGYDYHVYKWNEGDDDADLLSLERPVRTPVTLGDGSEITHVIPSAFDCRSCHESNDTVVIGFDELRLAEPAAGASQTQLQALAAAGVFAEAPPSTPDAVSGPDPVTRQVLGYLHGNCAHCHNDSANTMSALSLEHGVALANILDVPTEGSGQASGIRVVPGSPEESILFQAFSGEGGDADLQAMPPIGVQVLDARMIEVLRSWIAGL